MDYPGWELERQRAALAALLLGGGAAEAEGVSAEGEGGWGWEDAEAAGTVWRARDGFGEGRSGGRDGRTRRAGFAALGEGGTVAAQEGFGRGGRERLRDLGASVSAWEEFLGVEAAPEVLERRRWGAEEPGGAEAAEQVRGDAGKALSGGTGARRDGGDGFGGRGWRDLGQDGAAGRPFGLLEEAVFRGLAPEGESGGRAVPAGVDGGDASAVGRAAGGRLEQAERFRRGGEAVPEDLGQDGLTVPYEGEGTVGTGPWGGGWNAGIRAEDGARALSRAVQRDARRYDGGFTIY